MRIKQIRSTFSIGIGLAICTLLFVACNNDNSVGNNPVVFAPVTAVELSVDGADFTGTCPHTFKFTGTITTSAAGTVAYRFTDFDTTIKDGTVDFSAAGTQTVTDEFVLTRSGALEVILEIPRQNFLSSNIVSITATCVPNPFAGSWNVAVQGSCTAQGPISISTAGRVLVNGFGIKLEPDCGFIQSGDVSESGSISLKIADDGDFQIGDFAGNLHGLFGSGTWETALGKSGTWSATKD